MANTFKNAVTGSSTSLGAFYTCPVATTAVVHAVYLSNVDGVNDETISLSVSGIANFNDRKFILKLALPLTLRLMVSSLTPSTLLKYTA
jgi:hypothetical protein